MDDKKTLSELEQVIMAGDAWLRKFGAVSSVQHNSIVLNLYVNFPKVQFVEYFMSQNPEERKIHVVMHYKLINVLFRNRDKIIDQVIDLLKEYLHEYAITVEIKRYHRGVERKNVKTSSSPDNPSGGL